MRNWNRLKYKKIINNSEPKLQIRFHFNFLICCCILWIASFFFLLIKGNFIANKIIYNTQQESVHDYSLTFLVKLRVLWFLLFFIFLEIAIKNIVKIIIDTTTVNLIIISVGILQQILSNLWWADDRFSIF